MDGKVKFLRYDKHAIVCIPVIASFSYDGQVAPIRVRIEHEVYKVESYSLRPGTTDLLEYTCQISKDGTRFPVLLYYYPREKVWCVQGEASG